MELRWKGTGSAICVRTLVDAMHMEHKREFQNVMVVEGAGRLGKSLLNRRRRGGKVYAGTYWNVDIRGLCLGVRMGGWREALRVSAG